MAACDRPPAPPAPDAEPGGGHAPRARSPRRGARLTPRAFTDEQREALHRELVEIGRAHFSRLGYRRASVADIAREAGIGKGTFYLFFESKAALFLTIAGQVEVELRERQAAALERRFDSPRERIAAFLRLQLELSRDHPFLWIIMDPEEAQTLFRELPEGAEEALHGSDEVHFAELVASWRDRGWIRPIDPAVFGASCRALYTLGLHPDLIGEEAFPEVVELLIESLADRLAPEA